MFRAKLRRRREGTVPLDQVTRIRLTTLPTDIDLLRHMNNGRYLSLFDLGRWDMTTRTGLGDAFRENGWYAVVANETITFRKSLELFTRFDIETRWIGHDERALYIEHRAVVDGEVYARAVVRGRILSRSGGSVTHEELFGALGFDDDLPAAPEWAHDWAEATRLPATRKPAPSTWD
jgi:acyl-CoA thioesterase FadM